MALNDKIANQTETLTGKAKEGVGNATGNQDLQAQGKADQAEGNLKQAGEKVKDAIHNITHHHHD